MWAFLPKMATNFLQARYYEWKYAPNSPSRPKPGSTKYKKDYKKFHIFVIVVYLIYNFYQVNFLILIINILKCKRY